MPPEAGRPPPRASQESRQLAPPSRPFGAGKLHLLAEESGEFRHEGAEQLRHGALAIGRHGRPPKFLARRTYRLGAARPRALRSRRPSPCLWPWARRRVWGLVAPAKAMA